MSNPLQIVILMGGMSKRLTLNGIPKAILRIQDQYLFEHSVKENLKYIDSFFDDFNLNFVLGPSLINSNVIEIINEKFSQSYIHTLSSQTSGPLETLKQIIPKVSSSDILVLDCDLAIDSRSFLEDISLDRTHSRLCLFTSQSPLYSFAKIKNNKVLSVAEKIVISEFAIAGLYYFSKNVRHDVAIAEVLGSSMKDEVYISDYVNFLLKNKTIFKTTLSQNHRSFGTEAEYFSYLKTLD